MCRQKIVLLSVILIGLLLSGAKIFAVSNSFTSTNGNWSTSGNWSQNSVPSYDDGYTQKIGDSSNSNAKAIVDSNVGSINGSTYVGYQDTGTLEIKSGGILSTSSGFLVGYGGGGAIGNVNITGGSFTVTGAAWTRLGYNGDCYWNQSGGTVDLRYNNGWGYNGSVEINLSGGELYFSNGKGPNNNVDITISGTGKYIVSGDETNDLTLDGIVSAAAGYELSGTYSDSQTTISASVLVAESTYYVATDGNDNNSGTQVSPFKTIGKARTHLRSFGALPDGGVTVYIREGKYFRSSYLLLQSTDQGEPNKPIVYQAYPGETVRIIGGEELDPNWFSTITSSTPGYYTIPSAARAYVKECNLPANGITNLGSVKDRGYSNTNISHMELSFEGKMMQLARWPNTGFETTAGKDSDTVFSYSGSRPDGWTGAANGYVFGYWYHDWADDYISISSINTATNKITLGDEPTYGIKNSGARWYGVNLLEELDTAGEYYLDETRGILYFYPPSSLTGKEILVSTLGESHTSMIYMDDADYVQFKDITFEMCRSDAFYIVNTDHALIDNCVIRNIGQDGIITRTCTDVRIENCDIYGIGETCIELHGGDRATLTNGENVVRNNKFYSFSRWCRTYTPAVRLFGCGNEILHNDMNDSPHTAIFLLSSGGNNHIVRYNRIWDVCKETSDAGAVYYFSDWGFRGNEVEYNVIRDIDTVSTGTHGVHAIYLDGGFSSVKIHSNVIYDIDRYGIFVNGGRDNNAQNNVMVKCYAAHATSRWGTDGINQTPGSFYNYKEKIEAMDYNEPPWSTAYPKLASIFDDGYDAALEPEGNVIARNIGYQNDNWTYDTCFIACGGFNYYTTFWNETNSDPLFIDEANNNFALQDDSPAYDISGFKRIPFERIGILDLEIATRPNPADNKTGVSVYPDLYWGNALDAQSRDVYLGTSFNDVNDANTSSDCYMGSVTDVEYASIGLEVDKTHYWRIDEKDSDANVIATGDVWSFTTEDDPNLIGRWTFDDGSGTTAFDISKSDTNGTVSGATWTTSGKVSGCLSFDGTNDYVSVPNDVIATLDEQVTICFWAYGDENMSASTNYVPFSSSMFYIAIPSGNDNVYWMTNGWTDYIGKAKDSSVSGTWTHWAFTKNTNTGWMRIYKNGSQWHWGTAKVTSIAGSSAPSIGRLHSGSRYYYGKLDDFRIYDKELSAAQIDDIYEEGL